MEGFQMFLELEGRVQLAEGQQRRPSLHVLLLGARMYAPHRIGFEHAVLNLCSQEARLRVAHCWRSDLDFRGRRRAGKPWRSGRESHGRFGPLGVKLNGSRCRELSFGRGWPLARREASKTHELCPSGPFT